MNYTIFINKDLSKSHTNIFENESIKIITKLQHEIYNCYK